MVVLGIVYSYPSHKEEEANMSRPLSSLAKFKTEWKKSTLTPIIARQAIGLLDYLFDDEERVHLCASILTSFLAKPTVTDLYAAMSSHDTIVSYEEWDTLFSAAVAACRIRDCLQSNYLLSLLILKEQPTKKTLEKRHEHELQDTSSLLFNLLIEYLQRVPQLTQSDTRQMAAKYLQQKEIDYDTLEGIAIEASVLSVLKQWRSSR
jgi:hypothetical protein